MCGKSSFINRISRKNSLKVGNKPGVTVKKQWIRLSQNIELLDTPGVLWPKFESEEIGLRLAFTGTIKDEILDTEDIAFFLVKYLIKNYLSNLCEKYKLDQNEIKDMLNTEDENQVILDVLEKIGKNRRLLCFSGGRIDNKKTSNILLNDFREARIGKITLEKAPFKE